ncbi:MAG: stage IV sporulation protein A [Clostridiales bacterium]|jgi:stage IV sporulation protein A|nr:stage IV sporulation protein A [Clostridiales bacterium]
MLGQFDIYNDIQARTGGEIYIGVVGPVRTGKSTFIKRFMDLLVIPGIEDVHSRERAIDELPQAAAGKTIMTTEPKFIPKEAAEISLNDETKVKIRLIDCVGYMVEGASGHIENDHERMVKTPWFDYEIPFTQAAEIGTRKVINDHSTIGIVVTTDGSFGEIPRTNYMAPEEKTIEELKRLGKPFIVILNTSKPYSNDTLRIAEEIAQRYDVTVIPLNCEQLRKEDIHHIMENVLSVFPISEINFYMPKWAEILPADHWLKKDLIASVKSLFQNISRIKDVNEDRLGTDSEYVKRFKAEKLDMQTGAVTVNVEFDDEYYYKIMSDLIGVPISGEYQLIATIKELAGKKSEFDMVSQAVTQVKSSGYGIVSPLKDEICIEEPEIMKHGSKYGVKIKASAPSIHMIRAEIMTEVAPIVGTEEQAKDLINYINENARTNPEGIWETNIFGKSIRQLVEDGINSKINKLTDDSRLKLQETMQKIINDSSGALVCIII